MATPCHHRWPAAPRVWLAAVATCVLAACGGGSGTPPAEPASPGAVQLQTGRSASARIGSAGGSVSATAADGRTYTLSVPAGALAADTEITATPVSSMGDAPLAAGLKGAVRFGPAGLAFGLPATLRIEGAATTASANKRLVGFVRSDDGATMQLVPVTVAGHALELPVPHFSDGGVAEGSDTEIAAIPLAPIVDPVQQLRDTFERNIRLDATEAEIIALLVRIHDQQVAPLLDTAADLADDRSQDQLRESAVATWAAWQRLVTLSEYPAEVFGDRVAQARARAGGLLLGQVDRGRTACLAPPPVSLAQLNGLYVALWAQKVAQVHGLDAVDLGLDAANVARRLNDCARVAFVPTPLPTLTVGQQASLDARAGLIFAANPNVEPPVEFAFTLSSPDATIATPQGFSDLQGRYTSVVTPRVVDAAFELRACLVTFMANLAPVPSVMCERQTVGGRSANVLSGTIAVVRPETGSIGLRVRVEPGGQFTVLAASGTISTATQSFGLDDGEFIAPTLNDRFGHFVLHDRDASPPFRLSLDIHRVDRDAAGNIVALQVNYDGIDRNPGELRRE